MLKFIKNFFRPLSEEEFQRARKKGEEEGEKAAMQVALFFIKYLEPLACAFSYGILKPTRYKVENGKLIILPDKEEAAPCCYKIIGRFKCKAKNKGKAILNLKDDE
jgi:hypothetical protein